MNCSLVLGLVLAFSLPAHAEVDFEPIKQRAGAEAFAAACAGCHAPGAPDDVAGPPLEDVAGRVAGAWVGYAYSDALAQGGFVWTDTALRAWMEDNTAFMPGSKMRHDGIVDPVVQDLILSHLHAISMGE
jgi:cytochrome c